MLDARDQAMIYWYDARSYARAAERLSDAEGYGATMVTYFAWSHAIELSLKAILIAAGWSIQECQLRLRHDLQKALVQSKSIGLVLSEATEQVVLTLSPLHAESHAFRYRPQSNYSFPRAPITQAAVDEIVGRVEEMLRKRAQDARG